MWRRYLLLFSLAILFVPHALWAAEDSLIPEFNPLCWKATECRNARLQFLQKTFADLTTEEKAEVERNGFVKGEAPCVGKASDNQEWGKCLPGGVSITKISFGGVNRFSNLGTFLQAIYRYAMVVVGILAAVMVVVAGFQWVTSGGNAEMIGEAQHRIMNAIIGALIAYGSFFILNTINPDLVQLKPPQVYMVRPQSITPQFCSAAPPDTKFAVAKDNTHQSDPVQTPATTPKYDMKYDSKTFGCGNRYFAEGGGSSVCWGDGCAAGSLCIGYGSSDKKNPFHCEPGLLAGTIGGSAGGLTNIQIDDDLTLVGLCKSGSTHKIATINVNNEASPHAYIFKTNLSELNICGGKDKIAGFFLSAEVNDEAGGTGNIVEGADANLFGFIPTSWGEDDWHLVGRSGPGSRDCSVNLAKVGNKITKQFPQCEDIITVNGCAEPFTAHSTKVNMQNLAANKDFTDHLLTYDELTRGFQCDLNIDRGVFPALSSTDPKGTEPRFRKKAGESG